MNINNNNSINHEPWVNANNSLERISTGLKLNSAADDAASLAISENLKAQYSGISQSIENTNSGLALAQIADRSIGEQTNLLDGIKEKLLQASTATTSDEGREQILKDIQKSLDQVNNIAEQTNYNGQTLLQKDAADNSASESLQFQSGEDASNIIETESVQSNTTGLGLDSLLNQDPATFDADTARAYLDDIDQAISKVNDYRGDFGTTANQLESNSRNLSSQYTSTREAESILSNVNYANEVSDFSKQNILAQVGAYGQAQANNITQHSVLRLLQ